MSDRPPVWAETLLRAVLALRDREAVSGDLLEQYRDSIRPARGRAAADAWYVAQVAEYFWRRGRVAVLTLVVAALAGVWVPGNLVPLPEGASFRVVAATALAMSLAPLFCVLFFVGARVSWHAQSIRAGTLLGGFVSLVATGAAARRAVAPFGAQ